MPLDYETTPHKSPHDMEELHVRICNLSFAVRLDGSFVEIRPLLIYYQVQSYVSGWWCPALVTSGILYLRAICQGIDVMMWYVIARNGEGCNHIRTYIQTRGA